MGSLARRKAENAYTSVLNGAGATKPSRDSCDTRVVNSVINQSCSIINDEDDVGGWPTLASGSAPTDTDGYTNLEEYLNSL